jgi:hypothetical protein
MLRVRRVTALLPGRRTARASSPASGPPRTFPVNAMLARLPGGRQIGPTQPPSPSTPPRRARTSSPARSPTRRSWRNCRSSRPHTPPQRQLRTSSTARDRAPQTTTGWTFLMARQRRGRLPYTSRSERTSETPRSSTVVTLPLREGQAEVRVCAAVTPAKDEPRSPRRTTSRRSFRHGRAGAPRRSRSCGRSEPQPGAGRHHWRATRTHGMMISSGSIPCR